MFNRFLTIGILSLLLVGCAGQIKTKYNVTKTFELADKNLAKQKKGGIEIELMPLGEDAYKKSYFTQNINVSYVPFLSDKVVTESKPFKIDFFDGLTAFKVHIINNTDHILRMKDSRVLFIDPDLDEPIMGLTKSSIMEDVESAVPYYNTLMSYILKNYKYTDKTGLEMQLVMILSKIVKKIKFINGFNKEIMPGMRASGTIIFPVTPEQASQGKISFIDMVSKTDKAGNPLEKVRFDYTVKVLEKYWKYNPKTDKDWVEITAEDYKKGQQKNKK